MNSLPTGTVTLLFTDIEGSTKLLQQLGERYARILAAHHEILRACFEKHHGRIVDTQGDSFFVCFARAMDAVNAAVDAQRALHAHAWDETIRVRVRMGLHTGEPTRAEDKYVGLDVHRAARIGAAGYGGQILLSETTLALIQNELPRAVSVRDLGKQRLKDFDAPAPLFQIICADLPSDFPPLKTIAAHPNNLPAQLSSFIGRERELDELASILQTTRLLTLSGAGGAGKTRLSIQLAEKMLDAFPDGVWFIELARVSDAALIPQTIATALGVRDEAGNLAQTLTNYLERKTLLLVFDNCEHLIDAAAQHAENFLRAAPKLKIVATSREALNLAGEHIFHVPSLPLPQEMRGLAPETLLQSDAARLFVERATAANNHFRVTAQNVSPIAQICRRLDGIPLALELAAARVNALSAEQIAVRLDDVFRLLSGGSRTAMPRQQTLAAAIEWSYNLLSDPERALLSRLSAFAGGWTLDAAEQICAGDGIAQLDILDLLTQLVNKSLVIAENNDGATRYRFLETIRQFARYRLFQAKAVESVSDKHLDFFVAFAERAVPELHRPNQIEWLKRLDAEHDNLRAALTWTLSDNPTRAAQALRLTGALWMYWDARGYFQEGLQWCERALAASDAQNSARVQTMFGAGGAVSRLGNLERMIQVCQEALTLARSLQDERNIAEALLGLGYISMYLGETARADEMLPQALAIYNALGDKDDIGRAQGPFAQRALAQGDYARAAELYSKSLELFRQVGDVREIAGALNNLASVVRIQGDLPHAHACAQEALELYIALADKHGIATSQRELGAIARAQGDLSYAQEQFEASRALFEEMGDRGCLMELEVASAALLCDAGENTRAAEQAQRVIADAETLGWSSGLSAAQNILVRLALADEKTERAQACARAAFAAMQAAPDVPTTLALFDTAAQLATRQNEFARAAKLLGAAQAQREKFGVPRPPIESAAAENLRATLRAALEENFSSLWEQGYAWTMDEARKCALEM
ncbi:MAG: hypothetical protein B6D41_02945 [Chloroflexi bacterium UTCFX4]|nr:MAG: hypothetical protein B6D41_02945 [Chloroflexi bacterium UTCFX4]